jgi:hypothetical protein
MFDFAARPHHFERNLTEKGPFIMTRRQVGFGLSVTVTTLALFSGAAARPFPARRTSSSRSERETGGAVQAGSDSVSRS